MSPPRADVHLDPTDPDSRRQWKRKERSRLIDARRRLTEADRRARSERLVQHLGGLLGEVRGACVSAWWPLEGEPDIRPLMATLLSRGATVALPVVLGPKRPLGFRRWEPSAALVPSSFGVLEPADGELLRPDVVLAPLVGFDRDGYRLGHGGGFYDRTLAALDPRPRAIGVGFEIGRLDTIHPDGHDVPMDAIVTDEGVELAFG